MARKVFISVLGTGFYNECNYYSGDFAYGTRFIQQATLAMHVAQNQWTADDAAYILLTDGAKKNNWQIPGNVRRNVRTKANEEYIGLKDQLDALSLPMPVMPVDIADGKDEAEMWDIFDTVYCLLREGDSLYFDVTHGFRYLPMFVVVLGNYAKFMKNVTVKGITYGNFEAHDDKGAPIMDLLSLSTLQNWTYAAADFLRHGDAKRLKECATAELTPILKETKGRDTAASDLRRLCTALSTFSEEMAFCRGMDILAGKSATDVETFVGKAGKNYLRPFVPLFDHIRDVAAPFVPDTTANIIYAARLCFRFGNYQAAATLLEEGVATFFCLRHGIAVDDKKKREAVNKAFTKNLLARKDRENEFCRSGNKDFDALVDRIATDCLMDENLVNRFTSLQTDVRNDINHAGMRKLPAKTQNLRSNLEKILAVMEHLVENNSAEPVEMPTNPGLPPLLINLSNHPYREWQDDQRQAAEVYGPCKDMPFPQIDPDADEKQIDELVKQYAQQIAPYTKTHKVTVHLMGEMCFTYRLVKKLTCLGIITICSTTARTVHDEGNGKRTVQFRFQRFREYEG